MTMSVSPLTRLSASKVFSRATEAPVSAPSSDTRLPSRRELWDRVRDQAEAASELPEQE